ncbi:MAG TPA: hypothetical protein VH325_10565 [Bryobacteraceae bacterium]|jgi:hypothetical protein|nr:hypothetical protein [Bryobacteraceae bacterium]
MTGTRRVEIIQKTQATIAELKAKYGLALGASRGEGLFAKAKRLGLLQGVLSKTIIPCQAELKDDRPANPCLIVPQSLPVEMFPAHKRLAVGGQVESLSISQFTLPRHVMEAAWRPTASWQGGHMPILVSIHGEYKYLVRTNSLFFRCGEYTGSDLDTTSPAQPQEYELKRGRYNSGDDLSSELALVVAEF